MNYGMIRVASASLKLKVANPSYNKEEIKKAIDKAVAEDVRILVTPELSLTGSTCGDLFFTKALQQSADAALDEIIEYTKDKNICVAVGAPYALRSALYNCVYLIQDGWVKEIIAKHYPDEKTQFSTIGDMDYYVEKYDCHISSNTVIDLGGGAVLGVEIGDDLLNAQPMSGMLASEGANIIINPIASVECVSRANYRKSVIKTQSVKCICAYVSAGASVYESTTNSVYSGATYIAENGKFFAEGERYSRESVMVIADVDYEKLNTLRRKSAGFAETDDFAITEGQPIENENNDLKYRKVDALPFIPDDENKRRERCQEIFSIQANALARRLDHIGSKGCVIGISGGLDSTLALLVSVEALKILGLPASDIIAVTMPGFGTTGRTYNNAIELMKALGVSINEISIKEACLQHFKDIGHNPDVTDVTYENAQARERTQILFDMANKYGSLVVGTGDLSELAMGWCTFSGDHMSMYGVNATIPKTLVRYLVDYVASVSDETTKDILIDILETPVSPELLPPDKDGNIAQKSEEKIGPYELLDFFIYNFVRFGYDKEKLIALATKAFEGKYDKATIEKWATPFFKRFFISQFKRSCSPDGVKVGSVSLSPRGDWTMPSDAFFDDFID